LQSLILTISCKDKPGIIAEVTKFLFENGFNIVESGQFNDKDTNNFFMRTEFQKHDSKKLLSYELLLELKENFKNKVSKNYDMKWDINFSDIKVPALIFISKEIHCLDNIFLKKDNLNLDIKGVISNHNEHKELIESNGIDFFYLPIKENNKRAPRR
jgi:formyltetrahydrofolate deformylase